jgi:hypothetical protein
LQIFLLTHEIWVPALLGWIAAAVFITLLGLALHFRLARAHKGVPPEDLPGNAGFRTHERARTHLWRFLACCAMGTSAPLAAWLLVPGTRSHQAFITLTLFVSLVSAGGAAAIIWVGSDDSEFEDWQYWGAAFLCFAAVAAAVAIFMATRRRATATVPARESPAVGGMVRDSTPDMVRDSKPEHGHPDVELGIAPGSLDGSSSSATSS